MSPARRKHRGRARSTVRSPCTERPEGGLDGRDAVERSLHRLGGVQVSGTEAFRQACRVVGAEGIVPERMESTVYIS